jgi:hypothetical protein
MLRAGGHNSSATGRLRALPTPWPAITRAKSLDYSKVQAIGQDRFDPQHHYEALAARNC